MKLTDEKRQRLNDAVFALQSIINVCNDILGGASDLTACRNHNVNFTRFENLMSNPITGCTDDKLIKPYAVSPAEQIYCDIVKIEPTIDNMLYIPYDIEDTLNEITPISKNKAVYLRYHKGLTFNEIAKQMSISPKDVRNQINQYLRTMRMPENLYLIKYGKTHYETMMTARKEHTNAVRNSINNGSELPDTDFSLIPVDVLDFDVKTLNSLHKCNIHTLNDLLTISITDIESKAKLGTKVSTQIIEKIAELSVHFQNLKEGKNQL